MSNRLQQQQYENAAQSFLKSNPQLATKYYSPTLLKTLVDAMQSSLPTIVTARLSFDRLVVNGLQRTDGKTDQDDLRENVNRAQTNLNKAIADADAAPLTTDEVEYFGSLSQRELSQLYYGPDGDGATEFAVRYNKAVREFGFIAPPKFGNQSANDGGEVELTAQQYHAIPATELKVKIRDPKWKAAIYKLIKAGAI